MIASLAEAVFASAPAKWRETIATLPEPTPCHIDPEGYTHPGDGSHAMRLRQRCGACVIKDQCLDFGVSTGGSGIYGGEVLERGRINR